MKARIKFRKYGVMKFIGHLDIMRYFQKSMRRAEIPIAFSKGYSPHMIMSFANPLGVGLTSDGEYLDIELVESISSKDAVEQLNKVMVEGIDIISFKEVPEKQKASMALVAAARYLVQMDNDLLEKLCSKIEGFLDQEHITIMKKTKKSEREVDLKPFIYELKSVANGVELFLASGSVDNIKPELVMKSLMDYAMISTANVSLQYHRCDVYARDAENGEFLTLENMAKDI